MRELFSVLPITFVVFFFYLTKKGLYPYVDEKKVSLLWKIERREKMNFMQINGKIVKISRFLVVYSHSGVYLEFS